MSDFPACRFFATSEGCRRGAACKFAHIAPATAGRSVHPQQGQAARGRQVAVATAATSGTRVTSAGWGGNPAPPAASAGWGGGGGSRAPSAPTAHWATNAHTNVHAAAPTGWAGASGGGAVAGWRALPQQAAPPLSATQFVPTVAAGSGGAAFAPHQSVVQPAGWGVVSGSPASGGKQRGQGWKTAAATVAPPSWKGGKQQRAGAAPSWNATAAGSVAGSVQPHAAYGYAQPLTGSYAAAPAAVTGWHAVPAMVPAPVSVAPAFPSAPAAWASTPAQSSGWGGQQATMVPSAPHMSVATVAGGAASQPARKVCAFYKRGNCKFGSKCKQSHDLSAGPSASGGAFAQGAASSTAWPAWGGTANMEEEMHDADVPTSIVPAMSLDMLVGMQARGNVPAPFSSVNPVGGMHTTAPGAAVVSTSVPTHAAPAREHAAASTLAALFAAADFALGTVPTEPPPLELCTPVPPPR